MDRELVITEIDMELHRRAIDRLRTRLFGRYSLADYGFDAGTEELLAPSAYLDMRLGETPAPRRLHFGGLRYRMLSSRAGR